VAVPFAIGAFILCFFLKEVPLRTEAYVVAQTRPGSVPGADGSGNGPAATLGGAVPAPADAPLGAPNGVREHVDADESVELPSL